MQLMKKQPLEQFSGNKLFTGLKPEQVAAISRYLVGEKFAKGELIFAEGSLGERVYLIVRGTVDVQRHMGDAELTIAVLSAGDFFGEMAFFLDRDKRSASAYASSDSELYYLNRSDFNSFVDTYPDMMRNMLSVAVAMVKRADDLFIQKMQVDREVLEAEVRERTL